MNNASPATATTLDHFVAGPEARPARKVAIDAKDLAYVKFLSVLLNKPLGRVVEMLKRGQA